MTKGGTTTMSAEWLPPTAASVAASIIAWALGWKISAARFEAKYEAERNAALEQNLTQQKAAEDRHAEIQCALRDMREDFRTNMARVGELADRATSLQSSQNVVNSVTAKALEGLVAKQDQHAEKLADHASTLKLATGMMAMLQQRIDAMQSQFNLQEKRVGFEK